jgi:hypothetical protein
MRRFGWWGLLAVLACALGWTAVRDFPNQPGMDLFHPWGIARVMHEDPSAGSPYVHPERYGERLYRITAQARATDPKLWVVGRLWRQRSAVVFEPTATPFYYAVLSVLPAGYDQAHLVFATLQYLALIAGVALLARLGGFALVPSLCVACAVGLVYTAFGQDVYVANVNTIQLLFVAVLVWIAERRLYVAHAWIDILYLPIIALGTVFKPNLPWIAAALAAHYALVRGPRAFFAGAALAVVVAFTAVQIGAMYFGSFGIWPEWLTYLKRGIFYSIDLGNQSLPMLMAEKGSGFGPVANSAMVAACIGLAFLVAVSAGGKRQDLAAPTARSLLADAWFAASVGVVLTCAATPLFWIHYDMLALVPILYFVRAGRRPDAGTWCAAATFVILSVPFIRLLNAAHLAGTLYSLIFFAWAPLLGAVVWRAVRVRRGLDAAAE